MSSLDSRRQDSRKQAVSIRMSAADVRRVKKLAKRFEVRDSDVIRFAVKSMLSRLGPLSDSALKGRNLVPVFADTAAELFRYLDIDVARLDSIINEGVEPAARVDHEDIQLLAMSGAQQSYAMLRLSSINGLRAGESVERDATNDGEQLAQALRRYLYDKYGYSARNGAQAVSRGREEAA